MFEKFFKTTDDLVPENLRPAFEKKFVDELKREARKDHIAEQLRIPAEIAEIQKQVDDLTAKLSEADTNVKQCERVVAVAKEHLKSAHAEWEKLKWTRFELRGRIDTLKSRQASHGSPLLQDAYSEFYKKWDELRLANRTEERVGTKNWRGKITSRRYWTNRAAVTVATDYVRNAMKEIEGMMIAPLSDEEIQTRLDALRKGIPSTQDFVIVDVEIPEIIDTPTPRYTDSEPERPRF